MFNTDGNSAFRITVKNQTYQTVSVGYFPCDDAGIKTYAFDILEPGQKEDFYVCEVPGSHDYIEVILGERKQRYEFDVDFWGNDEITVKESDFSG